MKKNKTRDSIKVKGMFRVNIINPDGTLAGDSGFCPNAITNNGFQNYLCKLLASSAGSAQIGYVALGTGTVPNATHDTLDGEVMSSTKRTAVTASVSSSTKLRFTATFPAGFLSTTSTLQNIGLFKATTTNDTLFAGNTYATSSCASNQACNISYDITFA